MTIATDAMTNRDEQDQLLQQISPNARHRRSHTVKSQTKGEPESSMPQYKASNENGIIQLLSITEVPPHLAFNQNIRTGYRNGLTLKQCISRFVVGIECFENLQNSGGVHFSSP